MEKVVVKILVLTDQTQLISQIEEVSADIGEPDCKLTEPFLVEVDKLTKNKVLTPWLIDVTDDNQFMISSDKILTLVEPNTNLLNKYQDLLK